VINYEDQAQAHTVSNQAKDDFIFKNKIEFKNVSFSYNKNGRVLSDFNMTIPKGSMVGIIGPSGEGKTTIVDLLLSLIRPQTGEILVDNKNLQLINNTKVKQHIGYVSQDIFLMNDSVRNNIKFYNDNISDQEIIAAAKMANIYDFIIKQPKGFDMFVGERGMELSGGQRQRIALARVLARKTDVLILDEATSSLDNESEIAIQKTIEDLHGKVTIFIIAHRPTTVLGVDRLLVLKNGRIIEDGLPQELLKNENSYFHKMYYLKR
jgi:ABC-type multidrug transport system fused ATPase/permease subunit